ncbi:unnamed protein product [Pocillopora meandrina]|uniref:Uncharacterized protein n=1 Tax=Pocillopora meandrina TaxID=46732 RepID=A0AAU9Y3S4_9CNID|nr:unnamed protein product [Pocillopora meandrina]CAH3166829.1 unnamed protein product [Pocillopora meandrina]
MRECFKIRIMGCLPSRRQDEETSPKENSPSNKASGKRSNRTQEKGKKDKATLAPTIQMVNADTLKLLQEIGELKMFQTASDSDHKKHIDLHHDIMLALENPTKASNAVTSVSTGASSNVI